MVLCLQVEFDRPIAGFINICPGDLSTHETQLELAVATVKHEMLHALVGANLALMALCGGEHVIGGRMDALLVNCHFHWLSELACYQDSLNLH